MQNAGVRPCIRHGDGLDPSLGATPRKNGEMSVLGIPPPKTEEEEEEEEEDLIDEPSPSSSVSIPGLFDVDEPFEAAKSRALRMLSFAPLSSWEVQHRLRDNHAVPEELAGRVAEWLRHAVSIGDAGATVHLINCQAVSVITCDIMHLNQMVQTNLLKFSPRACRMMPSFARSGLGRDGTSTARGRLSSNMQVMEVQYLHVRSRSVSQSRPLSKPDPTPSPPSGRPSASPGPPLRGMDLFIPRTDASPAWSITSPGAHAQADRRPSGGRGHPGVLWPGGAAGARYDRVSPAAEPAEAGRRMR